VKKDDRFKVEEKIPMGGNVQSIEATIYKSNINMIETNIY
jgi:hypothetical protein